MGMSRKANRLGDPPHRRANTVEEDQQRDVDLGVVEAAGVAEELVLAEVFAVVGGDDHQRVVEQAVLVERIEKHAELFIEVRDAVVVGVAG